MPTERLNLLATVERRADATALLGRPGDAVVVRRERDRLFVLRCPCGCGEDIVANLDRAAGPAWVLYRRKRGTSLFPSVWLETGCKSHFIVWDDSILLFGRSSGYWDGHDDNELEQRVLVEFKGRFGPTHYLAVAEILDEVPWAVSRVCRRLVRAGRLKETVEDEYELAPAADH